MGEDKKQDTSQKDRKDVKHSYKISLTLILNGRT